ncbi:hypothetical protein DHW03_15215 [Pedobacter yonginense]|uniref:MoaF-like domain-containing protein n=1 Tax=Pedobacter yonginense TaxID=651869 RepID=A0A317EJV5_9SPHI|nr:hypothetical protein [Pedobacter yonginense]PWS26143.1 hypothetical protein DHW03_15215 [Pedobacter yonginense]
MEIIFKNVAVDFGDLKMMLHFKSDTVLAITVTEINTQSINITEIIDIKIVVQRPMLLLLFWNDAIGNIITQIHDYEKGVIHSNWISTSGVLITLTGSLKPIDCWKIPILLMPWVC